MLAFAVLCSCQRPRLIIIHTNDTHSHFEPVRGGSNEGRGGCIERAAFLDSIRTAEGKNRVLLLHAGDFSQGSSYFSELEGRLEPIIINDMGYDCITMGNHELDNGPEALCERLKVLKNTKVVCANLDLSSFELSQYVSPYAILRRGGLKIGIIGLEADISTSVANTVSSRIPVFDNQEVVNKWEKVLKEDEKCDLVILLSHLGYDKDRELVPVTQYIDIVIGGHTHTFVDDILYEKNAAGRDVPIITDGCWGMEMGKLSVY